MVLWSQFRHVIAIIVEMLVWRNVTTVKPFSPPFTGLADWLDVSTIISLITTRYGPSWDLIAHVSSLYSRNVLMPD